MPDSLYKSQLRTELDQFPLLNRYLGRSLSERIGQENWHECRVLRYVLSGSQWVADLEETFRSASIDTVTNSEVIFSGLSGAPRDYDSQLLDALAEVRLVKWARQQGYDPMEKLSITSTAPDFHMWRGAEVAIAEAKNLRARDFLLDFLDDRIHGLAFKTRRLANFGLLIETGDGYERKRDDLIKTRADRRSDIVEEVRGIVTEEWLESLERGLGEEASGEVGRELLGIPFVFKKELSRPGAVDTGQTYWGESRVRAANNMLAKLNGLLNGALNQIRGYADAQHVDRGSFLPVVFVSGMGPEERD
jgi:hypothetical protein